MPSRDRQAHQIDDDELWEVVERDLPDLIAKLEAIVTQVP